MVDMFFYRDPEEVEKEQQDAADAVALANKPAGADSWGAPTEGVADWGADVAPASTEGEWAAAETTGEWGASATWDQ